VKLAKTLINIENMLKLKPSFHTHFQGFAIDNPY